MENTNKEIESIRKDVVEPRLTITPSRITVKIPNNFSDIQEAEIITKTAEKFNLLL